jgi:tetratricopeptide (TPR) repeat protein
MTQRTSGFLAVTASLGLAVLLALFGLWWYRTSRPEYRLRKGQDALLGGDVGAATATADRLLASGYPDHAHLLRGQAYLRTGRLNAAIEEYNQIRDDNEEILAEASLIYGLGFLSLSVTDRAEKLLLHVASVRPDNVDARRGLVTIYYDRGAMTRAARQLEKWSELDDADGRPHRLLGLIYKDLAAYEPAVRHYQAALERRLAPAVREEVIVELAEVFLKRTQSAEALACLQEAKLTTAAAQVAASELRAAALYDLGRGSEAVAVLDPLLHEGPASPRALRLRAQIHADNGEFAQAVPLLEKALQLDRHEPACRFQLALAYERLGRRQEAAEQRRLLKETQDLFSTLGDLNREADQKPTDEGVRRRLVEVCERLGKFELAQMWRRAADSCQGKNSAK